MGNLPVGWRFDPSGKTAFGWAVSLLPYVGQPALHDVIDTKLPVNDPRNRLARETTLAVMLCPSDIAQPSFTLYEESEDEDHGDIAKSSLKFAADLAPLLQLPTANYVGMFGTFEMDDEIPAPIGDGAFLENRKVCFRDFQRGLSQTLLVGERTMAQVPSTWYGVDLAGEDASARLVGAALEGINKPYADECDFSSRHPGGANFLFADGHVEFITEDIDLRLYHEQARLRDRGGN
jgi:prepilin-type processing-associated H-X9-DG protein